MIKRYNIIHTEYYEEDEDKEGEYVKYEDYAALKENYDALNEDKHIITKTMLKYKDERDAYEREIDVRNEEDWGLDR